MTLPRPSLLVLALAPACASPLPEALPALADFERPRILAEEPDDEAGRQELPPGCFSGIELSDARDTLEALAGEALGVQVSAVVENSPAHAADVRVRDLLLEATPLAGAAEPLELRWPSDWRAIELDHPPGTRVALVVDRAGRELELELELVERVAPAAREPALVFEESERVGVVLRRPSEVEARALGLPPGAGAIVIGLARSSPWRAAGIAFEDTVVALDGERLGSPQALLDAIRSTETGERLALEVAPAARPGERRVVEAPVSARASTTREVAIPLLFGYEREGERRFRWSALLGILGYERTPVAWRARLLWLFRFGRGDTERLLEVDQ